MGCHFCQHSTDVCVYLKYSLGVKRLVSRSFVRHPAWVNQHTPFRISKYMKPCPTRGKMLYW